MLQEWYLSFALRKGYFALWFKREVQKCLNNPSQVGDVIRKIPLFLPNHKPEYVFVFSETLF